MLAIWIIQKESKMPSFIAFQVQYQSVLFAVASVVTVLICVHARERMLKRAWMDVTVALLLAVLVMTLAFRAFFYLG